jgi:hypothetical protein
MAQLAFLVIVRYCTLVKVQYLTSNILALTYIRNLV